MMDLGSLTGLLSSFSRINRLNIEIRDGNGQVYSSNGGCLATDISSELNKAFRKIMTAEVSGYKSVNNRFFVLGVPIQKDELPLGVILAYDSGPGPQVNSDDLEVFLKQLGEVIIDRWESQSEIEDITEELIQSFEDLYLFSNLATNIKTLNFSGTILREPLEELLDTMRVDMAFIVLLDNPECNALASKEGMAGRVRDQNAFSQNLLKVLPENIRSSEDNYFMISNSKDFSEFAELHPDVYRFLLVKVRYKKDFYGWIGLVSFNLDEFFRKGELRLLSSMAEQVAMVITNTALFHDLERFVVNMVKSLVFAIEANDRYTRGHSERVSKICMLIAARLNLDEEERNALRWASILHDVGKIGIPEQILTKPGCLTDEEYRVIQEHPEKGYKILKPLEQLSNSLTAILHHHERFDGLGYPDKLKGEEVPKLARIIAVADTFDAINSDRAYRPAKSADDTMIIIQEIAGTQLDPELVRTFEEIYDTPMLFEQVEQIK